MIGAGLRSVFSKFVLVLHEGLIVYFLEMSYRPIDCNLVNSISRFLSAICCIVDDCMDISHLSSAVLMMSTVRRADLTGHLDRSMRFHAPFFLMSRLVFLHAGRKALSHPHPRI